MPASPRYNITADAQRADVGIGPYDQHKTVYSAAMALYKFKFYRKIWEEQT